MKRTKQPKVWDTKELKDVIYVKNCPKCGGIPRYQEVFFRYWVVCSECGFTASKDMDLKQAVKNWNSIPRDICNQKEGNDG